jgi:hypothetical protein
VLSINFSVEIKTIRSVPNALFESKLPLLDERAGTTGKAGSTTIFFIDRKSLKLG